MINKFLLFGLGGVAVTGTGTGLGVYYGTRDDKAEVVKIKESSPGVFTIPKIENEQDPEALLRTS